MIIDKVRSIIKRYNLIHKGDGILIGVSGGADSLALLCLLSSLKKELRLTLHIAHLDHKLRKDSGKDRAFVERFAKRLKIPITSVEVNIKQLAKLGSLEEIARNARLGFFFRVAKEIKADKIALGHNLDDQAETVLMRILRGTGLYGLSGILPKRNIAGYEIIRPLIEIRRKDIEAYLKRKKIKPCIDASNLKEIYFRNKIRNRLLPLLEKDYNKNIKEILSNMAESLGYDYDYLMRVALRLRVTKGTKYKLNLNRFMKLHPAIQRLVLRLSIARLKGDTRRITFRHIREIGDLVMNRPVNSIVDLPKGVSVIKGKEYLSFALKPNL
ncbi:MAG: tRNA lysidine(34) synthetase TilS [Candidatus Omnitrophota bacterium]